MGNTFLTWGIFLNVPILKDLLTLSFTLILALLESNFLPMTVGMFLQFKSFLYLDNIATIVGDIAAIAFLMIYFLTYC